MAFCKYCGAQLEDGEITAPGRRSSAQRPVFFTCIVSFFPFNSAYAIKRFGRSKKSALLILSYFILYSALYLCSPTVF